MIKRWHKKRTQYPIIALTFFIFIVFSILYNENNIQQIHRDQGHNDHGNDPKSSSKAEPFVKFRPLRNYTLPRKAPVPLDKDSSCLSTVNYTGRRLEWDVHLPEPRDGEEIPGTCDIFSGRWVYDNMSYPLYNASNCPYMSDQLACQKHGRQDLQFQYWRWQPHGCDLKRWNVTDVWEKLRGKRLMFVGDSLNRGQWISMVCLLQHAIPADKQSMSPNSHLTIFRAENYNASVEFLWAPVLVESNSDDPVNHRIPERILRPDSIHRHESHWRNADILVFNSYLWWRQDPVKLLWSTEEQGVCEEIDGLGGMELAMEAWANWVAFNVEPEKQQVFFVTMSPTHFEKGEWDPGSEGNCYDEKLPIEDENYWGSGSDLPTMQMVGKVLRRLSSKVSVLNITQLSEYRKDAHPTIYRKFWETLSPEKLANPASYSDCIHWCLPGVSDVWNELLYQFL